MFGTILKATNSSFQKGKTFCRSIYVKKVMELLAFIFEQPSYVLQSFNLMKPIPLILKPRFLDLHLFISNDTFLQNILINVTILNYAFLDGDVPHSTFYGVYISQLI